MTSSKPDHFPKPSPPSTITLGFRASIYEFWRKHKHSVHDTHLNDWAPGTLRLGTELGEQSAERNFLQGPALQSHLDSTPLSLSHGHT